MVTEATEEIHGKIHEEMHVYVGQPLPHCTETCLFGTGQGLARKLGAFRFSCDGSRSPKSGEAKCCSNYLYPQGAGNRPAIL
jgi:hypothetical protein